MAAFFKNSETHLQITKLIENEEKFWADQLESFFERHVYGFHNVEPKYLIIYVPLHIKTMIANYFARMAGWPHGSHCELGIILKESEGQRIHFKEVPILTGYENAFLLTAPYHLRFDIENKYIVREPLPIYKA